MTKKIYAILVFLNLIPAFSVAEVNEEKRDIPDTPPSLQGFIKVNPRDMLVVRGAVTAFAEAKHSPVIEIPKGGADSSQVNLSAGEAMPEVFAMLMNPTSIEFVDITGEPWPLKEYFALDPFLTVKASMGGAGNAIWVSANKPFGQAVISVYLKDLPTAISVLVTADNTNYHRVKNIKVMRLGVNANVTRNNVQMAEEAGQEVDEFIMSAAHGIRPSGYTQLSTNNENVIAWTNQKDLLIYTDMSPIIPNPIRVVSGTSDKWTAFRLPITTRIQMTNEMGKVIEVVLENRQPIAGIDAKTEQRGGNSQ